MIVCYTSPNDGGKKDFRRGSFREGGTMIDDSTRNKLMIVAVLIMVVFMILQRM